MKLDKVAEVIGMLGVLVSIFKDKDNNFWVRLGLGDDKEEETNPKLRIDHDNFIEFIKEICRKEEIK